MRKMLAMLLVAVLLVTMSACRSNDMLEILEVDNGSLAIDQYNHEKVISDDIVYTQEYPKGQEKTIQINGESWSLKYEATLFYPLANRRVNKYVVDGTDNKTVLLYEDGTVYGGSAIFQYLNISKMDTPETVQKVLVESFTELVDLTKYETVEVEEYIINPEEGFLFYKYLFYNSIDDALKDYVIVWVDKDGAVYNLWIITLLMDAQEQCKGIDKEREEALIVDRLKMIYESKSVEYRSYSLWAKSNFCIYENELYIQYHISAELFDTELEQGKTEGCELLIPVQLLTES